MVPLPTDPGHVAGRKDALYEQAPDHPVGDLAAWRSTIVFSPHPDDESLGCGGLILHLTDRGQEVRVVFVSDGSMSHPNSQKFSSEERTALREREALAACSVLGVPEDRVHFLRLPDGRVPGEGHPAFAPAVESMTEMVRQWSPDTFVVPWRRDLHEDHRATWDICRAAVNRIGPGIRWVEYPVWMWEAKNTGDLPRQEEMITWSLDIADVVNRKVEAIRAHASQWNGVIDDDASGFQLSESMIGHFTRPREIYFEPAEKRHRSLGGEYFAAIYQGSEDPWQFETSEYERGKYAATLAALPLGRYDRALEIGCSIGVLTEQLAERCEELLAVDVSEAALERARDRLANQIHVELRRLSIPQEFPEGSFNLVVLSEVGYYWSYTDLERAIDLIQNSLRPGGVLLLVHYTPYVPDYPLTGDEVHEAFARKLTGFERVKGSRADRYRLDVWKKKGLTRSHG
ncbi:PIG-L family deacetylase [Neolewinella litorea]|nr:PIG-L family deacetylase [Neolewinella litorea]